MPRVPVLAFKAALQRLNSATPTPTLLKDVPRVPALTQWFSSNGQLNLAHFAGLQDDPLVSLEHTSHANGTFERMEIPLSYYLSYLNSPPPSNGDTLYLAQFPIPPSLASSLPAPPPIQARLSHSSLWLGLRPTTPLHQDPDDNVLYQLAGSKRIRLLAPNEGQSVLDRVRKGKGGRIRGEEMMRPGPSGERDALEAAIWESAIEGLWEGQIEPGEALLIPRGWWHAVRGRNRWDDAVGEAGPEQVNGSVNWWFR